MRVAREAERPHPQHGIETAGREVVRVEVDGDRVGRRHHRSRTILGLRDVDRTPRVSSDLSRWRRFRSRRLHRDLGHGTGNFRTERTRLANTRLANARLANPGRDAGQTARRFHRSARRRHTILAERSRRSGGIFAACHREKQAGEEQRGSHAAKDTPVARFRPPPLSRAVLYPPHVGGTTIERPPMIRLSLRFLAILTAAFGSLLRYAWRRLRAGRIGDAQRESLRGEVLADLLQRLGATYVKFGQILSTRPDLFGPGYTGALARLQDQVAPVPLAEILEVLDEDLDPPTRIAITHIDPVPLAAASVAQVHVATTVWGDRIALKVLRKRARAQVEGDLVLLTMGARFLDLLPSLRMLSLPGAVARFGAAMRDQLDFRLEAANNRRFAANFADTEGVDVPALYDEFVTERVLGMELIEGVRGTEPEKVGGDRRALALRGLNAILQMVFRDGFVHADLHPGNIILTPDARVVLIDLGLVAEIDDDMRGPWIQTFVALAQQDGRAAARLFYTYAPTVGPDVDYQAFEDEVQTHFAALEGKALHELEASKVLSGMMDVLRRHQIQTDPVFTVVNLAMLVAEGLGKQLDPDLDLITLAAPYLVDALANAPTPRSPLRQAPVTEM